MFLWQGRSRHKNGLVLSKSCNYQTFFLFNLLGLTFEIAEGGFLDIDVRITGPNGVNIYQGERETSGKYSFSAHTSGVYTYCFSNKMSTMTPKVVMFNMAIGESPKAEAQNGETANKLDDMIRELSGNILFFFHTVFLMFSCSFLNRGETGTRIYAS